MRVLRQCGFQGKHSLGGVWGRAPETLRVGLLGRVPEFAVDEGAELICGGVFGVHGVGVLAFGFVDFESFESGVGGSAEFPGDEFVVYDAISVDDT